MTAAYRHVAEALAIGHDGQSPWSRRQRSLLLACEIGFASARQRRQAERMLASDPQSRVMLAELRVALRDVAAALPLPVVVDDERVRRRLEWVVDVVDRVLPGGHRAARQLVDGAASTNASESIGLGAGVVGAGAAAKVALACLAAGGTVAICLSSEPEPARKPPSAKQTAPTVRAARPAPPAVDQIRPASFTPKVSEVTKVTRTPERRAKQAQQPPAKTRNTVVSSPTYEQVASPAPPSSTEFGPGVVGSSPTPIQPAPAPTDGGGEFTP